MSDALSIFDTEGDRSPEQPAAISERQRLAIRAAFAELGLTQARDQFDLVKSLTGKRIRSPHELTEREAGALLIQLARHVQASTQRNTGNAWADRDEETWIDKL